MNRVPRIRGLIRCLAFVAVLLFGLFVPLCSLRAAEDEPILHDAGLSADDAALLAFFQARARTQIDAEPLDRLLQQFCDGSSAERERAMSALLGLGPLVLAGLRQIANDLDHPQAAQRAARCLPWLEGAESRRLLIAAAHLLGQRKPTEAAGILLNYLPCAEDAEVSAAVNAALAAVAAPKGKPEPALLRGLTDRMGIRRAAAAVALCRAVSPEQAPDVRKLLKDPALAVRLRAARALAEAHDAAAIPVLIDLLAELPAEKRNAVEVLLKELAGEWALTLEIPADDPISRGVRRDAWASWWHRTDGPKLLAVLAQHTLTPDKHRAMQERIAQLGSEAFPIREEASQQLLAFGRLALPRLREAVKKGDAEVVRRAKQLIERIEKGPDRRLPLAAVRLLALRKPAGAVEALLAYFPFAEEEIREEEVRKALVVLAARNGKPDEVLQRALTDTQPKLRALAAEVLIESGDEGRAAVRKLLAEDTPSLRLRAAMALARSGQRDGVTAMIELLPLLSAEECGRAEYALYQLAGDTAPQTADDKKKSRDAWLAWWKVNADHVDLSRVRLGSMLGYTVLCDNANERVFEIDRKGKERWSIGGLKNPVDAVVLPGNRVLIADQALNRVAEYDFKGNILWQKEITSPVCAQRLPNGHTFIVCMKGSIVEVDRQGQETFAIGEIPGQLLTAARGPQGDIVCLANNGQCRILDSSGKLRKQFAIGHDPEGFCILDLNPKGHFLVTRRSAGKVVKFDREGKTLCEFNVPGAHVSSLLPNGNILVADNTHHLAYEMDRAGKIVWEYKTVPNATIARVRRR